MPAFLAWPVIRAFFGGIFGRVFTFLRGLNAYQLACLALVLLLAVDHLALVMAHRHGRKVEAQLSAAIGQLKTSRANEVLLRGAIADQNAKVAALGAESARQQNEAAKAVLSAAQRAKGAEATSQRLAASAAHSAPGKPCEPSEALTSAWQ
jgi:hypothetical protein